MSKQKTPMKSMYVVGEIEEPEIFHKIRGQPFYLFFSIIGITLYLAAIITYLFSAAIMSVKGLREEYANWGFLSLTLALLLFTISKFMRNHGYVSIKNEYQHYTISTLFGKHYKISKPEIYAVNIRFESALGGLVTLLPYVYISTHRQNYRISLFKIKELHKLYSYFSQISEILTDEFYTFVQTTETTKISLFQRIWTSRTGRVGFLIIMIYALITLWGVLSMILYPNTSNFETALFLKNPELSFSFVPGYSSGTIIYLPPNSQFLLGTDWFGRDILARLIYGTVHSLAVATIAATLFIVLSMIFGYTSGLSGGTLNTIISRFGDLLLSFPPIIPLIIVATFVSGIQLQDPVFYYYYTFIFMSFLTWPQGMRLLQVQIKSLLDEEYLAAARQLGGSPWYLFRQHVFPKTIPTLVYLFVFSITDTIIAMTMLGLIGLGLGSTLTWGSDIERAITFARANPLEHWWTLIYPSIWVSVIIIGLLLLSDTLRDHAQTGGSSL